MDWRTVAFVLASVLAVWAILVGLLWVFRPRDVGLGELLRVLPDIVRLVRRLLRDRTVPLRAKVALWLMLVWLISPIDVIPEFIPVLGPIDDVVVTVLVLRFVRRIIGLEGLRSRWPGTSDGFALLGRIIGSD